MPNPYTFIPSALPQNQAQRIYGEVGAPAPTSFTDPLVIMSPDWSTSLAHATITEWPADHGSELPVVGDAVLLEQDSRGIWRVASWEHAKTTWGGVTLPATAPGSANLTILSNGTGGSTWSGTPAVGFATSSGSMGVGTGTSGSAVPLTTLSSLTLTLSKTARVRLSGGWGGFTAVQFTTVNWYYQVDGGSYVLLDHFFFNTANEHLKTSVFTTATASLAAGSHTISWGYSVSGTSASIQTNADDSYSVMAEEMFA